MFYVYLNCKIMCVEAERQESKGLQKYFQIFKLYQEKGLETLRNIKR